MDNSSFINDMLREHGLKKTRIRSEMLSLFINNNFALSASDIILRMKAGNDRVTIYRALASFEENGILHKASEDRQGIKYAICENQYPDKKHSVQHAHFRCDECQKTFCLNDVVLPNVKIPNKDFSVNRVNYTIHGTCNECKDMPR
ncbi:Fur family transcriptional regulator [Ekhidna sp.]